jgi:hypothetical protein
MKIFQIISKEIFLLNYTQKIHLMFSKIFIAFHFLISQGNKIYFQKAKQNHNFCKINTSKNGHHYSLVWKQELLRQCSINKNITFCVFYRVRSRKKFAINFLLESTNINVTIGRVLFSDPIAFVDAVICRTYFNLMVFCLTWLWIVLNESFKK